MKNFCLLILSSLYFSCVHAQQQKMMAFPLTGYFIDLDDSVRIVQVVLPGSISVKEKQPGLVKSVFNTETGDTMKDIGAGRCNLIKSNYYYFTIKANNRQRKAAEGDLLYCFADAPLQYEGILFGVMKHSISLKNVYDSVVADLDAVLKISNAAQERLYLKRLTEDVKYTGAAMLGQGTVQNITISGGRFNGQKILNAMQTITEKDLEDFLLYVNARPANYAGHSWKISEIMATWMNSKTPTVIK